MIIEVAGRKAVAVAQDVASARYDCASMLTAPWSGHSGPSSGPGAVRLLAEIRRNLGGMIMRAMVGGEFRAGADGGRFEVCVDRVPFDSGAETTCDSELGPSLIPGLPSDFAPAALSGLLADPATYPLSAGVLRIDRAGHDLMGSSEAAFDLAARVLRAALSARLNGTDLDAAVRSAYTNAPQ
jgi:hypothetical protein